MMTHAIKQNREYYILQIIQLKNLISKNMNNLLTNHIINKINDSILKISIMKIIKFKIIIKLLKGQNEHILGKSYLIFKKMRKNFRKLMNLKNMIRGYKIIKIIMNYVLRSRKHKSK